MSVEAKYMPIFTLMNNWPFTVYAVPSRFFAQLFSSICIITLTNKEQRGGCIFNLGRQMSMDKQSLQRTVNADEKQKSCQLGRCSRENLNKKREGGKLIPKQVKGRRDPILLGLDNSYDFMYEVHSRAIRPLYHNEKYVATFLLFLKKMFCFELL